MSLRGMLWDLYNHVEIFTYNSLESFIHDSNRHFVHFFVSADILFSHIDEFDTLKGQTTVMTCGANERFLSSGFNVLDISHPEHEIANRLLQIQIGQCIDRTEGVLHSRRPKEELSSREKEVLTLMVKGLLNKEMAARLGISLTTVIFHRNNVCSKLGTRSIGRLTIYAVLEGLIDINEI